MNEVKGLIFDIQGFSVHDGPGSRTTVFLSGCPLRCEWCANPEGRELREQLLFSSQKCHNTTQGCRRCVEACPAGALKIVDGAIQNSREQCRRCSTFACCERCHYEALRHSGHWRSVNEVMQILRRDRQFWENGGVTFSGGEPLMQREFLLSILRQCKKEGIHTAIETSAYADSGEFLEVLSLVDFAFIDIKHMDPRRHMEKTGVDNQRILENIVLLRRSGWKGRLILRIPVIRGYNDCEKNIKAVIGYMQENQLYEINLLPFHRMGASKWAQLGLDYEYKDVPPINGEDLEALQVFFLTNDIACYIGDEVMY